MLRKPAGFDYVLKQAALSGERRRRNMSRNVASSSRVHVHARDEELEALIRRVDASLQELRHVRAELELERRALLPVVEQLQLSDAPTHLRLVR